MYSLIARTLTRPGYRRQAALLLGSQPAQAQDVDNEFSLDSANDTPRGIWGNADTIWVVDSDKTIYAYNRSDGTRDASKDFGTLGAVGNDDPRGIWSDGTTMYVADWVLNKVFACKMSDTTHDSAKDITLDSSNDRPRGITGYGNTLWVIHDGVGGSNDKLYAYKLNPGQTDHGDRESSEEFNGIETTGQHGTRGHLVIRRQQVLRGGPGRRQALCLRPERRDLVGDHDRGDESQQLGRSWILVHLRYL